MKKQIIISLMLVTLILPFVIADIIIPTVTKVYFEQNGQPYNGKIDFTVKGYGYSTGMPGSSNYNPDRKQGTYTPEVVFSFSSTYNNYGDKIYENYYGNYRHIDYYEVEGKTSDGKTFIKKNIDSIPTNCSDIETNYTIIDSKYYKETDEYKSCISALRNYIPTYGPAEKEKTGATRKDNNGNTWTKQADGMWTTQGSHVVQTIICQEDNLTKPNPEAIMTSSEKHKIHTYFEEGKNDSIGSTRKDSSEQVWTKQDSNNWFREVTTTCFSINKTATISTTLGNIVIDEQKGGIAYARRSEAYDECNKYLQEVPDSEIEKDDSGHAIEQTCELKFNLDNAEWTAAPVKKGFWQSISCFFKKLFGVNC